MLFKAYGAHPTHRWITTDAVGQFDMGLRGQKGTFPFAYGLVETAGFVSFATWADNKTFVMLPEHEYRVSITDSGGKPVDGTKVEAYRADIPYSTGWVRTDYPDEVLALTRSRTDATGSACARPRS